MYSNRSFEDSPQGRLCARALGVLFAASLAYAPGQSAAETIAGAMAKAYVANPDLNEQRANVRVRDEDVPKAAAGMRPRANVSVNGGPQFSKIRQPAGRDRNNLRLFSEEQLFGYPRGASFGLSAPIFDGWRTDNSIRQAESGVLAAREAMRGSEQETLLDAATAYMNVLRDTAVLRLRKSNIAVLLEQLRVTRDRFSVGEVTVTDVAQSQASLAKAHSDLAIAQGSLEISVANYVRVIGEAPTRLEPAAPIDALLPKSRDEAVEQAMTQHPGIAAALHQIDAAEAAVKVQEGALLPTAAVTVQVNQQIDSYLGIPGTRQLSAQVGGQLNVPLYQGGAEYSSIRQAKEQLGQARIHAIAQRNAVRANVVQAFSQFKTAKASIAATLAAVKSAEAALKGVRDEAFFGQRTTLDVLNAQQALLDARVNLVTAQRDQIVASYAILAATGQLSAGMLASHAPAYRPAEHFEQVKDKWFGASTPSGE
ncbi:TolC family outer membrane protein [Methylocystis sp. S23]|jgi:outer membrane protein